MERDLVFLGGGHAHVLAIRDLAMDVPPGVRITLISEHTLTPYSGMLPGFIAGHYSFDETHVDLNRLCQRCNVRWIHARATGLDLDAKLVQLENAAPIAYDWLSIDTGSRPDTRTPGASTHAVGVKPVSDFAARWQLLLDQVASHRGAPLKVGVIGAGAGGVELALAIAHRLRDVPELQCHLVYPGAQPLSGYPERVIAAVTRALDDLGIQCHANSRVANVESDGIVTENGASISLDHTLWCTAASAPTWPSDAGLQTDERGFITVDRHLRSVSHPSVFAAGDIAHMPFDPRPKAGVYAVRQAPWLTENLRRTAEGKPLREIRLQQQFLSLLSLGTRSAVGTRNGITFKGSWVWWLKDRIDRAFMTRVSTAGSATMAPADAREDTAIQCAGCASKLGPGLVSGNLNGLPQHHNESVQPALSNAEDAATWQPTVGHDAVQSIDGFRAFTQDDYRLGHIAVNHALSDLYAMGATPVSALVWTGMSFNHPRLQARDHRRLMAGVASALAQQDCVLAGGHSSQGMESHIGLAVTGEVPRDMRIAKSGARDGDCLLLTKALGTGVILAAHMHAAADATSVEAAYTHMLQDNRAASVALRAAHALTDVTGYGLLGHLLEMLKDRDLGADIDLSALPALPGAMALLVAGYRSTLHPALLPQLNHTDRTNDTADTALCLDPQTSGGLLAAVSEADATALLHTHPEWRQIGRVRALDDTVSGARVRFIP